MQQLNVSLTIPIPTDSVLVKKVELQELKEQSLLGVYWNMKDLERRVGKKYQWIQSNILFPSHFRKILDSEHGGFVYYPKASGQAWSFQANKMSEFLDKHFNKIFSEVKL